MSDKNKKSRWDYLGIKPKIEEKELKEKFDEFVSTKPIEKKIVKPEKEAEELEKKRVPPFVMNILKWFQESYARMYFGLTFIWCTSLFLFLFGLAGKSDPRLSTAAALIFGPLVIGICGGLYMLIISIGPIVKLDEKWRQAIVEDRLPWWVGLMRYGLVVWPYYVYGWIPQKAYEWYFYKFSNFEIGLKLYNEEKYVEALETLEKYKPSIYNREESFHYHLLLGDCYSGIWEYKKAIASYRKAIDYDPDNELAQARLSLAYILNNKHNEGLAIARKLHQQYPEDIDILAIMARSYIMLGMHDDALSQLKKALSLAPVEPGLHKMLAEVYTDMGMKEKAIECASKALSLNPPQVIAEEAEAIINFCKESPEEMVTKDEVITNDIFCTQCGSKNPPDSSFCMNCGQKLE
jgi:Tfp pilus assembly protein PilF/ribosomal protein L40E